MFKPIDSADSQAIIKVIGIGGCGGNVVNYLSGAGIVGVDYVYIDVEDEIMALTASQADSKCPFPMDVADALSCKSDIDEEMLQYWLDNIAAIVNGADMIFIIAGMGGNTGSAIAPITAKLAREKDILTMAFAIMPFENEGKYEQITERNHDDLFQQVDSLVTIPNQRELEHIGSNATSAAVFVRVNDILKNSIQGIAELITIQSMIGVDFADVKDVIMEPGETSISTATVAGENRAEKVIENVLSSHRLDGTKVHNVRGLLVNIKSGTEFMIGEFSTIGEAVHECAGDNAIVVVGTSTDEHFTQGEIRVTVVATGLND